jgi:predicted GIY-YIG superfamily endonuclease
VSGKNDKIGERWSVYLLRCGDGSLYCGSTNDVERRVAQHAAGTGARYTRGRGPIELVAAETFADRSAALRAEALVKRKAAARKVDFLRQLAARGAGSAGAHGDGGQRKLDISSVSDHEASSGGCRSVAMNVPDQYLRAFSKEEINDLPLSQFEGEIRLIKKRSEVDEAVELLRTEPVIGFDTESKPSFKKGCMYPPALLQLGIPSTVFIFQLSCMPLCGPLRELLADPSIVKTGVAVWDDIRGLQRLSDFTEGGFMDLGDVSRELGMRTNGLRNLAANLLGVRISKSAQRSNWGRHRLSRQQITYAATDAWISRELHLRMLELDLLPEGVGCAPRNGNGNGNGNGHAVKAAAASVESLSLAAETAPEKGQPVAAQSAADEGGNGNGTKRRKAAGNGNGTRRTSDGEAARLGKRRSPGDVRPALGDGAIFLGGLDGSGA